MKFNIEKWYEVKIDSYKLIYEQAVTRFDEFASESESITNKSIKIFTAVIPIAAFFIGYATSKSMTCFSIIILTLLILAFILEMYYLYILIAPKEVKFRGVDPNVAANKDVFDKENEDYQLQATYFNLISVLKDNIDTMYLKNESRSTKYKYALLLFYGIILLIGFYVGVTLKRL